MSNKSNHSDKTLKLLCLTLPQIKQFREGYRLGALLLWVVMRLISADNTGAEDKLEVYPVKETI